MKTVKENQLEDLFGIAQKGVAEKSRQEQFEPNLRNIAFCDRRFAKSKTAFRPESSLLILALQFQTREPITPNRLFLLRSPTSSYFIPQTYLFDLPFRASEPLFEVHEL